MQKRWVGGYGPSMTDLGSGLHVVLVDDENRPLGIAPKATVHTTDTPLHRAFSCHVRGSDGRWLLSRRAVTKRTWPGVWTNAFCGHPDLDEEPGHAIARHGLSELGITVDPSRLTLALPDFRYRAVDDSGVVENEICPVWILEADITPDPNPDEVAAFRWVSSPAIDALVDNTAFLISPWAVLQWTAMRQAGLTGE